MKKVRGNSEAIKILTDYGRLTMKEAPLYLTAEQDSFHPPPVVTLARQVAEIFSDTEDAMKEKSPLKASNPDYDAASHVQKTESPHHPYADGQPEWSDALSYYGDSDCNMEEAFSTPPARNDKGKKVITMETED